MALPAEAERKAELIAALQRSRIAFTHNFQAFRRDVDVPTRLTQSFRTHKTLFLTGAAGAGWVLARLPFRRKKIYVDRGGHKKLKEAGEVGLLFWGLKFILSIFKPALAAFAARKVSAFVENREGGGSSFKAKKSGFPER